MPLYLTFHLWKALLLKAMLAAQLIQRNACCCLFQDVYDLCFRELRLLHGIALGLFCQKFPLSSGTILGDGYRWVVKKWVGFSKQTE
jgi:hypothetical protein